MAAVPGRAGRCLYAAWASAVVHIRVPDADVWGWGVYCERTAADTTGTHSVFATVDDYEVMFHVSTLLPFRPNDPQQVRVRRDPWRASLSINPPWQLERKRHIGNDICVIVYRDRGLSGAPPVPVSADLIKSEYIRT
jgi:hypothetical protein